MQTLPNIVYYNANHSNSFKCTDQISRALECTYTLPSTWSELTRELEQGAEYLAFHIDMINKSGFTITEFVSSIYTIHKFCAGNTDLKIMVLIKPSTPIQAIKELKKSRVLGIGLDLNYYSIAEVARCTRELLSSTSYWPEHIIDQLPGNKLKQVVKDITITHRQAQVLDLIKTRGLSNKQIARVLNIAEPTVKMHVSDIMKTYGVKSRVQLAVLA